MAQELLVTFETELGEVALVPGTGGVFDVKRKVNRSSPAKKRVAFPNPKS